MSSDDSAVNDIDADELSVVDILGIVWYGKWAVLTFVVLFALFATAYAVSQPNIYRAQVLLAPASASSGGAGSKLAKQFSGLASVTGVNLGLGQGIDMSSLAVEVMKSRKFQRDFIINNKLLVMLLTCSGWDSSKKELIFDQELYDMSVIDKFHSGDGDPDQAVVWDAYKKLEKLVSITQSKDTGMITVSVDHFSPYVAKEWVGSLVETINSVMKRQDLEEAKKSIAFLEEQLKLTELSEMQKVLYELIEEQTKTVMFSSVRDEYVFKIVDPAILPQEKFKPQRGLIITLFAILGGICGVVFVLVKHFQFRKYK